MKERERVAEETTCQPSVSEVDLKETERKGIKKYCLLSDEKGKDGLQEQEIPRSQMFGGQLIFNLEKNKREIDLQRPWSLKLSLAVVIH